MKFNKIYHILLQDNNLSKTNASVKKGQRSRFGTVPGELIKIIIDQIKKSINDSKLIYMFNLSQIVNDGKLSHYFMIDQLKSIISGCDHDIYIFVFIGKSQRLQKNIKKAFNDAKSEYNWKTQINMTIPPDYDKNGECWTFANFKNMHANQKIEQGCVIGIYADNIKELQNINTQPTNNKKNNQKQQQIILHESLFQNFNKIYLKYCITQSFNYEFWQGTLLHELQHYFDPMKDYLHRTRDKEKRNPDNYFKKTENGQHFSKKFITTQVNWLNEKLNLNINLNKILTYTATKEEVGPQMVQYLNFVIANYCNNNKDEWNKLKELAKNRYSNEIKKFFNKVKSYDINKATVLYLMLNFGGKVTETIQKQAEDILNNPKGSETYYLANNHNQLNNMA